MLKVSFLCALVGITLLLIGNFEKPTTAQASKIQENKLCFFVQPNRLNVRNAPNLESEVISQLPQNAKVCVYRNTQNGFLQTQEGWIATKHLSLEPFIPRHTKDFAPILASSQATKNLDSILASSQTTSKTQDSTSFLIKESYAKPQNKPKFTLTSTHKDSLKLPLESDNQSSIVLARIEMENQNYTRAKNLALRANSANPKNLESWEIFVKSVYLEGNPQEAILILQNFLQQNYDENLANLLKLMQQGQKI